MEIKRINLNGSANTRDLGGFKTADGRKIKKHRLIRSSALNGLDDSDEKTLCGEYNLKTVIDFRTPTEIAQAPDRKMVGVKYITNPILAEQELGITHEKNESADPIKQLLATMSKYASADDYMAATYNNIINSSFALSQYAAFFNHLLAQENGAVLWHCSAGKDRVGVGTMLLLNALGVPQETIMQDYLMTNTFTANERENIVSMLGNDAQSNDAKNCINALLSTKESYMQAVLNTIDQKWGSMHNFLELEIGLTAEKLERLNALYLE